MPLPSSGTISMSQINGELGRLSTDTIALDNAENGTYGAINTCSTSRPSSTNPASMSEWYSYNHNASCSTSCLSGTLQITSNCSSGASANFTVSSGQQAIVTMTGFYYSGSGTRYIYGRVKQGGTILQQFTYTQTGSGVGSTSPASYTVGTGTYTLEMDIVNCSGSGSGTGSMYVGGCSSTGGGGGSYDLYTADVYECANCTYVESIFVAFPAGTTVSISRFYKSATDPCNGYAYYITGSASGSTGYILSGTTSYKSCLFLCTSCSGI